MPGVWLGSNISQWLSHCFESIRIGTRGFEFPELQKQEADTPLTQPSRLVRERER